MDDAPPHDPAVTVVVLDTAWTPGRGDPRHLIPLRSVVGPILARIDLYRDALDRLEAWESAAQIPDRMVVDGVSWWFRQRPFIWYLLHEYRLWLAILDELGAREAERIEIRADEPVLADVAGRLWATTGAGILPEPSQVMPAEPRRPTPRRSFVARLVSRLRDGTDRSGPGPTAPDPHVADIERQRIAILDDRVERLKVGAGRSVMVVSHPRVFQVLAGDHGARLADPQLAPVMRRLEDRQVPLIHVGLELDPGRDEDWSWIEADDRLLPDSYVGRRWATDEPTEPLSAAVIERLRTVRGVPLEVDGVDLAPALMRRIERISGGWLSGQLRQARGARGMFDELRPAAMFLNHEGIRTPWMAAARAAGVPIHAVQHGIIYPTHPVYRHDRHPGLVFPEHMYVYGPYERTVLLERGAYRPDEVEVSGSPRLDVVAEPDPAGRAEIRADVRRSLGVADGHRMLVLSTANHVLAWRFHIAEAMSRILGGRLSDVHLVIKLHPGEKDEGPYRSLLEGLSRAGDYPAPPITIVHDIDLFRLLQATDAHLGFHSTVLTDAVAAGTPNLLAAGHATADLLGYVEAGVARPVSDVTELRAALDDPRPPDADARQAFLERHFRPGDASARIAAGIMAGSTLAAAGDRPNLITLRGATALDGAVLLAWANDPVTRAAGFRPAPITSDEHHRWLASRLTTTSGRLFIGEADGMPVGQVRLDREADGRVEVGISVAPEARGRGIGQELLRVALDAARGDEGLDAKTFVARIRPENAASIALFGGAGFELVTKTEVDGLPCLVFEAPV